MSDDQAAGGEQPQTPAAPDVSGTAEVVEIGTLQTPDPLPAQSEQPAAVAARSADVEQGAPATGLQPDADAVHQDAPGAQPAVEGEPGTAEEGDEQVPAEGYDAQRGRFVKRWNLGSGAPLHELTPAEAMEHPQTSGLFEATARAVRDFGYVPTGPAQLIHSGPDGAKSALTFAVPVGPRGGAPAPQDVSAQPEAPAGD